MSRDFGRSWAGPNRLEATGELTELESLILQAAFGEYLAQLTGGIRLSQVEIVRPGDLGIPAEALAAYRTDAVTTLIDKGAAAPVRLRIAELVADRRQFRQRWRWKTRRWTWCATSSAASPPRQVAPYAHGWHLRDELIPLEMVEEMGELGVFGLTIPEEYGGLGMGKTAMCVVSEELSRGYIGVGSLGTRSEIAAELILAGGTEDAEGKAGCRSIASGEILPTAVFTEPNTGSDLGVAAHPRRARGRRLQGHRQQDLDHPRRPRRPDDPAGPHRPGHDRLSRPVDAPGREAARHRGRPVPGRGHDAAARSRCSAIAA